MRSISVHLLVVFVSCFHLSSASAQEPVFRSDVVTARTDGQQVAIEADITDARNLYLVADDVDGFSFDWCDWLNPTLVREDGSTLKLTDLDWKSASSSWGNVYKGRNCNGAALEVDGQRFEDGIGTHAGSLIHFEIPEDGNFVKFTAVAGLDQGGVGQGQAAIETISVRFLVFTERPPRRYRGSRPSPGSADHDAAVAIEQFDVHSDLEISLFASEPMLVNPSNIDIDHRGRVWVCEVINYRGRRNTRTEGDRILVLEDTDADGAADRSTVFYQGRDIDSAHGILVLGDRALVSAGEEVFYLIDRDGDLQADEKQVLFTGISGAQHDHGIHAFVFGPDGKLYFNFGNEGRQIRDPEGNLIVDHAGQEVSVGNYPYQQGMVFRCNLDGSEFETLAWNFRNNWEVCVDSLGRMWQSDNDDDGNKGVRINYVMPFGNYGFRDEMTGAGWRTVRTGMAEDIPTRHWHQNDPGVIPNLLQTGAGSPTGICVYEGDALPEQFHGQVIHCDAGPNIVRSYPVEAVGAGYDAGIIDIMDGSEYNKWFRPSDVCVAPDGSLIVADWYDPGVGGHGMGDIDHGRLFRLTSKGRGGTYVVPEFDFESPAGAVEALKSPNMSARFLAWKALDEFGEAAFDELMRIDPSENFRHAVRAGWWVFSRLPEKKMSWYLAVSDRVAETDADEFVCALLRMVVASPYRSRLASAIFQDAASQSPATRRELLLCMSRRQLYPVEVAGTEPSLLWQLLLEYPPGDRWYLEAIGIACDGRWDELLEIAQLDSLTREQHDEILWRSRFAGTPEELCALLQSEDLELSNAQRFLRALDFFRDQGVDTELNGLVSVVEPGRNEVSRFVFLEALKRLPASGLTDELAAKIDTILEDAPVNETIRIVDQFRLNRYAGKLLGFVSEDVPRQLRIDAARVLTNIDSDFVNSNLAALEDEPFALLADALAGVRSPQTTELLKQFALNVENDVERRKRAVLGMAQARQGADALLRWMESGRYDQRLEPAISAAMHGSQWNDVVDVARAKFPLPAAREAPLPSIRDMLRMSGDPVNGLEIFKNAGTCAKCHVVGGEGVEVGPDLSAIGAKLSRQAMFESILFPSAGISHGYQQWTVLTADGDQLDGLIISETEEFIELKDKEGVVRRITVADIEARRPLRLSLMPADLHKELSEQELADLVEYLMRLRD